MRPVVSFNPGETARYREFHNFRRVWQLAELTCIKHREVTTP